MMDWYGNVYKNVQTTFWLVLVLIVLVLALHVRVYLIDRRTKKPKAPKHTQMLPTIPPWQDIN